jgi:Zn/Cd-binding protein ZinT
MKKRRGVFFGFAVMMIAAIFTSAGCGTDGGDNNEPELAKWAGTWNPVYGYLDDPGLDASFQAQYDALEDDLKAMITSVQVLKDFAKTIAQTDFGSFVIQGDKITFYDQKADAENPSGNVIETVTYTFKGIVHDVYGSEDFYASTFEGDKEGPHKYLIFAEEAERDSPTGPLHFHIRYGSKSFDDLRMTPTDNYNRWSPTIVSYNTTIAELQEFMSGD